MRSGAARTLYDLLLPLAMLACLASLAAALKDPQSAAETAYLALLAAAVLLPVAALPHRTRYGAEAGSLLVAAAVWALPAGATRGAVVGLLLTGAVVLELFQELRRRRNLAWNFVLPAALALQMLYRADRLLAPELDVRTLVGLLALPLAGGTAVAVLYPRFGRRALVAAGCLLVLAPGWRVAPVLALVALAAAARVRDSPRPAWAGLVATLAVAAVWSPGFALLLAACAVMLLPADTRGTGRVLAALALPGLALLFWPDAPWALEEGPRRLSRVALVLPAMVSPDRRRWPWICGAVLLAGAGLRWLGEPIDALAPTVALAALAATPGGPAAQLQRLWTGFLVAATALLAAYPWLRADPLETVLGRVALASNPLSALVLVAVLAGTGGALALSRRRLAGRPVSAMPAGLVLVTAAVLAALPPRPELPFAGETFVLDAASPAREVELDRPVPVSSLVIDSYLSYGVAVEPGSEVARLTVGDDGAPAWILRNGSDTGEWAARRPDVAALPGLRAPEPWVSWVMPGGFFAQRYRAVRELPEERLVGRLRISLAEDLPPEVTLAVFHLEMRP